MPYTDYNISEKIKESGTSHVYKVIDNDTGEIRAMKIVPFSITPKIIWLNEIKMLQLFQYIRGIVKMYEFGEVEDCKGENFGYVILEYCEQDILENPLEPNEYMKLLTFLYKTFSSIHGMGYCYCDLKLENILKKGTGYRLCDFSSCQPIGTTTNILYGTPHLIAPEIIQQNQGNRNYIYNDKIDIWGLGCLFYEIITQQSFESTTFRKDLDYITNNLFKNLLVYSLIENPTERPTLSELFKKLNCF